MRAKLIDLTEKRDQLLAQMDAIHRRATAEDRDLTASEAVDWGGLEKKMSAVDRDIQREQRLLDGGSPGRPDANAYIADRAEGHALIHPRGLPRLGEAGPLQLRDQHDQRLMAFAPHHPMADYLTPDLPASMTAADLQNVLGEVVVSLASGRRTPIVAELMASGSLTNNSSGGYLFQESLSPFVFDLARASETFTKAGMWTIPITGDTRFAQVSADPTVVFHAENETIDSSSPTFKSVALRPKTLGVIMNLSRELAEDASNSAQVCSDVGLKALNEALTTQIAQGSGSGAEMLGLVNADGLVTGLNKVESVGNPDWDNFLNALGELESDNETPTAMIFSSSTATTLRKLKVNSEDNHYCQMPEDLRPLKKLVTSCIPDENALVIDGRQLVLGLRQSFLVEMTTQGGDRFDKHQLGIKISLRADMCLTRGTAACLLSGIS